MPAVIDGTNEGVVINISVGDLPDGAMTDAEHAVDAHTMSTDSFAFTFTTAEDTDATTGSNKAPSLTATVAGTFTTAYAYARTAPTGADMIFDINLNGTSIWATNQADRLTIAAGANTGTKTDFDTTTIAVGDRLDIDIDQIGSATAGSNITVQLVAEV